MFMKKSLLQTLCTHTAAPDRPPELVLLTGQIHHLMAFNCDLLTSCWLVFSSQWPIAVSLVITLLKSSRELDNARELYMSPVSSATKNRTPPLIGISACLQWGATTGRQGGMCVCVLRCVRVCGVWILAIPTGNSVCECNGFGVFTVCAEIMWSEGVWLLIQLQYRSTSVGSFIQLHQKKTSSLSPTHKTVSHLVYSQQHMLSIIKPKPALFTVYNRSYV